MEHPWQVFKLTDQQVEFIEVTMHQAELSQACHHAHALPVDLPWIPQLTHLPQKTLQTQHFATV